MKTLTIVFLLMFPEVFLSAQVNNDSVYQYFPMNVGNVWKYATENPTELFTVITQQKNPSDPISFVFGDNKYGLHFRIDSLTGNIHFTELYNLIFDNIRVLPLPNDTSVVICDSIRTENILGIPTIVRYMKAQIKQYNLVSNHRSAW